MTIDYLADRREFIPMLARWLHAEWGRLRPTETVAARTARLEGACGHRQVPTAFVAVNDNADDGDPQPLGCASLVACDLATRAELSPWLAGVFVVPAHRGRGVGAALVGRVIEETRILGFPHLYLYTPGRAPCMPAWAGRCASVPSILRSGASSPSRSWSWPSRPFDPCPLWRTPVPKPDVNLLSAMDEDDLLEAAS